MQLCFDIHQAVCIMVCMKSTKQAYVKTTTETLLYDMAKTLELGKLTSDSRVQLKMPKLLVDEIDKEYPQIDRSKYFMWLAVNNLLLKKRAIPDDDLQDLLTSDQETLSDLADYLDERER